TYERLGRRGLQWPVEADGTDAPILYEREVDLPRRNAQFGALPFRVPGDQVDEDFPLMLVTGRRLEHYNAGTMTRRTANVELVPAELLEIHPEDAHRLGVLDGARVQLSSRRGTIEVTAQVTERVAAGEL